MTSVRVAVYVYSPFGGDRWSVIFDLWSLILDLLSNRGSKQKLGERNMINGQWSMDQAESQLRYFAHKVLWSWLCGLYEAQADDQ